MSRYCASVVERVQAAQSAQAKVTGVNQIQERHALPDSSAFIAENPSKFEVLKPCGNSLPPGPRVEVG